MLFVILDLTISRQVFHHSLQEGATALSQLIFCDLLTSLWLSESNNDKDDSGKNETNVYKCPKNKWNCS